LIAAHTTSFPRPIVNVMPYPASPGVSVSNTTYAAE
jgi:hypothetical protein